MSREATAAVVIANVWMVGAISDRGGSIALCLVMAGFWLVASWLMSRSETP